MDGGGFLLCMFRPKRLSLLRSGASRNILGRLLSSLDDLLLSGNLGLSTLLPASNVRVNPEHDKQVGQRSKVADVKGKSKQLTRSVQARAVLTRSGIKVVDEAMHKSKGAAKNKLTNLGGGKSSLQDSGDRNLEGRDGVVKVHDSVDQRVENNKNPNRGRCVSNASPHGEHGTSMVVSLEQRGLSTLGKDNNGIKNFVKLGKVKVIAVK